MSKGNLNTTKRDFSINPRKLRRSGKVPATLYGKGMESISMEFDINEFVSIYKKDKNAIFEIKANKETFTAIVKKVQIKPVNDKILHVEFQKISADALIKITVAVEIIGESPAIKAGGDMMVSFAEMEVECLPADIPSSIKVDISGIENLEDSILVSEVNYPKGVRPLVDTNAIVVKVSAPKAAEEEITAVEGEGAAEGEEAAETKETAQT